MIPKEKTIKPSMYFHDVAIILLKKAWFFIPFTHERIVPSLIRIGQVGLFREAYGNVKSLQQRQQQQ